MVYDGRMHIFSHVLLSHEAQQSLHHTAIVRSGGVSGTPSNAPKRLPLANGGATEISSSVLVGEIL